MTLPSTAQSRGARRLLADPRLTTLSVACFAHDQPLTEGKLPWIEAECDDRNEIAGSENTDRLCR
jgi:hypothetical protein